VRGGQAGGQSVNNRDRSHGRSSTNVAYRDSVGRADLAWGEVANVGFSDGEIGAGQHNNGGRCGVSRASIRRSDSAGGVDFVTSGGPSHVYCKSTRAAGRHGRARQTDAA